MKKLAQKSKPSPQDVRKLAEHLYIALFQIDSVASMNLNGYEWSIARIKEIARTATRFVKTRFIAFANWRPPMSDTPRPALNADRELWRETPDDYYSPSIHVTEQGGIGINVGGRVYVKPLRQWHALAESRPSADAPPPVWHPCVTDEELGKLADLLAKSGRRDDIFHYLKCVRAGGKLNV